MPRRLVHEGSQGTYRRFQELSGGVLIPETVAVSPVSLALGDQRFFLAGSGRLTLAVAGNVRALIRNPAGSGRTVYIARVVIFGTGTSWSSLYVNPTAGLPTTTRTRVNAVFGSSVTAVAEVLIDTNTTTALSGGSDTGITVGSPANIRTVVDLPPFVLSPGVALGINGPFTGAADVAMSIYWWEETT